ncbi:ABC transporter permease [Alkalicoccobacillus porphyridii]|uniref:ABC transporter permease n=1 Tax=Alkalicoccobacillus porphyridii TaxID=2597270 RepID=A0A554A427_9BACI|nr:ABC transporter permease [Alkalicoccobacillus porphyridii]TSB48416.1 ABC transporter permease [Alkalicoccobacillus porphyridii]
MKKKYMYLLLMPGVLFLTVFMVVPLALTFAATFTDAGSFSFQGYLQFFQNEYFMEILFRTIRVSLVTTFVCILLGFPAAYFISGLNPRMKAIMLLLSVFPLLVSPVVRSFSWMIILGRNGLLNQVLMGTGLRSEPLEMMYTPVAVNIGLIHLFLPLMIVTLVGVLETVDRNLMEAAESLGAPRITIFRKILLPLCVPGLMIGSTLVFVGSFTAYTTPALLGGNQRVISTFLYQNAVTLNDWHVASIVSVIMIAVTVIFVMAINKLALKLNPRG